VIRGQETAAKEKSFYQEEEITDKETVSPVDIAGSGQTNGDETAERTADRYCRPEKSACTERQENCKLHR